jgi:hypothetical protein
MAIEFVCPTCNGTLQVGDDAAGRVIRCGGCQSMLRVPVPDAGSAAPAPPASPFEAEPPPPRRPRADRAEPPPEPEPDRPRRRRRERDDDDEDRPRRRRDPSDEPPPPGRGAFFWLVVLGGVLFVGLLGCCGGLWLLLPKENWHTHESKDGGFKVDLPAEPRPNVADAAGVRLGPGARAEGAVYYRRLEHFLVVYRDIQGTKERADNGGHTDEQELDERVKRLLGATGFDPQTVRERATTVGGFPARELEYEGRGGKYTARVVVADTRVYMVLAGGTQPHDHPDVRKFLDSFRITDPKLRDEGQRREKAAGPPKEKDDRPAPRRPARDDND